MGLLTKMARRYRFSLQFFVVFLLEVVLWATPDVCGDRYPNLDTHLIRHNNLYHLLEKPSGKLTVQEHQSYEFSSYPTWAGLSKERTYLQVLADQSKLDDLISSTLPVTNSLKMPTVLVSVREQTSVSQESGDNSADGANSAAGANSPMDPKILSLFSAAVCVMAWVVSTGSDSKPIFENNRASSKSSSASVTVSTSPALPDSPLLSAPGSPGSPSEAHRAASLAVDSPQQPSPQCETPEAMEETPVNSEDEVKEHIENPVPAVQPAFVSHAADNVVTYADAAKVVTHRHGVADVVSRTRHEARENSSPISYGRVRCSLPADLLGSFEKERVAWTPVAPAAQTLTQPQSATLIPQIAPQQILSVPHVQVQGYYQEIQGVTTQPVYLPVPQEASFSSSFYTDDSDQYGLFESALSQLADQLTVPCL